MKNLLRSKSIQPKQSSQSKSRIGAHALSSSLEGSKIVTPLTPIEYPEHIRFEKPVQPQYSAIGSLASILSLVFMSVVSTLMYLALAKPEMQILQKLAIMFQGWGSLGATLDAASTQTFALWVLVPFVFTIFGSTLGWLFELGLLLVGIPFQLRKNRFTQFITQVRLLNLAPVVTSIFFFVTAISVPESSLRIALLFLSGATLFGLGFGLFFGTASALIPSVLLGTQILQVLLVLAYGSQLPTVVLTLLVSQSVLQFAMLLVGTVTPAKSTLFHIVNTIAGSFLFFSILYLSASNPNFSNLVAPEIPAGSLIMWGLVLTCLAGLIFSGRYFSDAYNNFRSFLSSLVWTPIYFKLVSQTRFPDPVSLGTVYNKTPPKKTPLQPYYIAHPEHLMQSLSIPAVNDSRLEANVTVFSKLLKQVASAFKLISFLDHNIPQANIKQPLEYKPRLPVWSNGKEFWPRLFQKNIFGNRLPNGGKYYQAPKAALSAYKEGQLLAYLGESGVANPFLERDPENGMNSLVMDFRFLEKYETKTDYESYGGVARFRVNSELEKLELVSIVAPQSTEVIMANPHNPEFRRAESMVVASMYYQVISGKHLAEIHMTYNLVEVAMHNAFDAQNQWAHPFRTFMYLHFFSHELAEEMTTEHLVQEGAVFSQIFATTHDGMINHLNDTYAGFEYGTDEDFEGRADIMKMENGDILPNTCIQWELAYFKIWNKYCTQLIDIIYPNDEAIQQDSFLQDFYHGLLQVLIKGLPDRYDAFQTKQGVARFAVDTIHHAVIRHQVYGTTGIRAALDPRISSTQIPRDTGTPAVDEWRSLAFVALATGEARFTLLTGAKGKDFTYLLDDLDEQYRQPMAEVFSQLQIDLQRLDEEWTRGPVEKEFNYNYFRSIPSVLHTGPGY